jgi:hypothetical protein
MNNIVVDLIGNNSSSFSQRSGLAQDIRTVLFQLYRLYT